jgi:integrase
VAVASRSHPICGNGDLGREGQAPGALGRRLPSSGMAGTRPLTRDQETAVRAALMDFSPRDAALIELMLGSGYRVGEIVSLALGDVWSAGRVRARVTVRRAAMKGGRSPWKRSVTARSVVLNPRVQAALEAYLFSRFGSAGPADVEAPLFPSRSGGGHLTRWRVNEIVHEVLAAAGVDATGCGEFGSHSLRKTFCLRVFQASGNNLALTRVAMSHTSIQTTQAYLPIAAEEVDKVVMELGSSDQDALGMGSCAKAPVQSALARTADFH